MNYFYGENYASVADTSVTDVATPAPATATAIYSFLPRLLSCHRDIFGPVSLAVSTLLAAMRKPLAECQEVRYPGPRGNRCYTPVSCVTDETRAYCVVGERSR
ncbi:hypothetical protein J6590_025379 [Homalodisca vitripennis]|nr:hypothetical protein J6590_025379 [Homalodisca vitripennis]